MDSLAIINAALARSGLESIDSLETVSDPKISRLLSLWDESRRFVFHDHFWSCLKRRAILSPDNETPAFHYDKQFTLPSDFLTFDRIFADGTDWVREGSKILTRDITELRIIYLADDTDNAIYDPQLVNCLSYYLTAQFVSDIKLDRVNHDRFMKTYQSMIIEARFRTAREQGNGQLVVNTWLGARRYWYGDFNELYGDLHDTSNLALIYSYYPG